MRGDDQINQIGLTKKSIEMFKDTHPYMEEIDAEHLTAQHVLKAWTKIEDEDLEDVAKKNVAIVMATHIIEIVKETVE